MSTPQEYRRVADELAALRAGIEALAVTEAFCEWGCHLEHAENLRALLDRQ